MSAGSKTSSLYDDIDWRPGADITALRVRAAVLAGLRAYFAEHGVLEVETPLLCRSGGTDPQIEPLRTRFNGPGFADGVELYLQTSPEFAMKRLLAAGSGPIYQICKAFRDGEAGRLHNPEFTMLEWYRSAFDLVQLMDEVAAVLRLALAAPTLAVEHVSYAESFERDLGIDIFGITASALQAFAVDHDLIGAAQLELDKDGWLDLLMSHLIQPALGKDCLCFVTDYPASQAALARLNPDGRTAARFEVFHQGIELANGFHELTDAGEQAARFEADNCKRKSEGQHPIVVDRQLLAAMEAGLPDCAGVAVGLDRLLMLRLGFDDIDAVLGFSLSRT